MLFYSGAPPEKQGLIVYSVSIANPAKKSIKTAKIVLFRPFRGIIRGVVLNDKEKAMNVRIEDSCTTCGLCVDMCPEVFEMGDALAEVISNPVPVELEATVQQAADECPVEAIVVE
jgi:ferredoxin